MMSNERIGMRKDLFSLNLGSIPDKGTMYNIGSYQIGFENGYSLILKEIKGSNMRSLCDDTIEKLEDIKKIENTSFMRSFLGGIHPQDLINYIFDEVFQVLKEDPSRIADKELLKDDGGILNKGRQTIDCAIKRELNRWND